MDLRDLTNPTEPGRPTVALFVAVLAAYAVVAAAALSGRLPLPLATLLLVPAAFAVFTPLHEACHHNIRAADGRWSGVEAVIGYLSGWLLLAPYPLFRIQHLRHHSFVNHPEKDPDFWVRGELGPGLLLRAMTILPGHYLHFFRHPSKRAWAELPGTVALNVAMVAAFLAAGRAWGYAAPLALWVVPGLVGLSLLALGFDWLPHHPHTGRGRYDNATVYTAPWLDVPLLMQNYHLVHHLYPGVHFYRYKQAFERLRETLEGEGAAIR